MARGRPKKSPGGNKNGIGANLGFEAKLWATADKLRGNMEPSDYKHVALGLIFLKYISDAFEAKRAALLEEELADPEDPEEYLAPGPKRRRFFGRPGATGAAGCKGAEGGPLVSPSGQRQAADHWQADRRCHARH